MALDAARGAAVDAAQHALVTDGAVQLALPAHAAPEVLDIDLGGLDWGSLQYIVWVVLAIAAIIIIVAIWRRLRATPGRTAVAAAPAPDSWRPELRQARQLLREADSLASAGQFAEAAHLLLLRSVEQIAAKQPGTVRPALTSRDIAAQPSLPIDVRNAFAMIAASVERSLFAGRGIDVTEWNRCRAAYADAALGREWA